MYTQSVMALVMGRAIMLFVPALVWYTVIANLIQSMRAKT